MECSECSREGNLVTVKDLVVGALFFLLIAFLPLRSHTAEGHHHHHHNHHDMTLDETGMVMNENRDRLPEDCGEISQDVEIFVQAGIQFAKPFADRVFGMSEHEWQVPPCSRVTVTFENQDSVRHQWMVHGLPRYLYDEGMFHLESAGKSSQSGTFIVPSDEKTYLVHCDVAQHMEKGMKGQLVVGRGDGDLWSIPGLSADFEYRNGEGRFWAFVLLGVCLVVGFFAARLISGRS